jgi:serine/threonine-protein kinase
MESGTIIAGRYRVVREVGRGSFGVVYLTDDLDTGESRAVKVLLDWAAKNESIRHRLRREAKLASHLHGPHVVRIYDCDEAADGHIYLVMEYLAGRELDLELRELGTLDPDRVASLATEVLEALAEAHKLGVIHRDIKPNNIFLCHDAEGREFVKVFDFGIAKVSGSGSLTETAKLSLQGGVMGTPVYMSPEQCRGETLTPASDFYSLGIVLYELLTGHVPFDDENPVQVLLKHNRDPVPPLPDELAQSPLGRAIARSLQKDAEDRFEVAEDFAAAIAGKPVPTRLASATPAAGSPVAGLAPELPASLAKQPETTGSEPPLDLAALMNRAARDEEQTTPALSGAALWAVVAAVVLLLAAVGIVVAQRYQ